MQLIPLHVHTNMSLLDSAIKVEDYIKWAVDNKLESIAITDHGSLSNSIQFYKNCIKNGLKPIIGIEMYQTNNYEEKVRDNFHVILLAKNKTGWLNLIKLHNLSYDNFHYKPRITFEDLKKYSDGIICCSACLGGIIPRAIGDKDINKAIEYILEYKKIYGDDFYIELQDHNIDIQKPINKVLIQLAKKTDTKLIATNDSHYIQKDDAYAHQILLCKQTQAKISDERKMSFNTSEFYLKTNEEMRSQLSYLGNDIFEECIKNSNEISDKVEWYDILQHEYNYPVFGTKEESLGKLTKLAKEGFIKRFTGKDIDKKVYLDRLKYEIQSIYNIGFVDYFLVLHDLYEFCDRENIYTGFGRGSGPASLVLYCLNVSHLDPIRYNLLFERFINPERVSAPDYDIDVDDTDRQKVVRYIEEKYGKDKVCNIATYGNLTSVSAFKAVSSVLEMPFLEANNISKNLIETSLSLSENIEKNDKLNTMYNTNPLMREIMDNAIKLEGGKEKRGIHAAGIVISNQPLENLTPIIKTEDANKNKVSLSCFEMKEIDGDLFLLKLDVLGLKNLSIVKETIRRTGEDIKFKELEFNDEKTFKEIQSGETLGVFQLESDIMKRLCRDICPKTLEDISVINAGARPGALESGLTESFINRRKGLEKVDYVVDGMEEYLKDTLGLPIFQENIMQLSRVMAGYSLPDADELRKIIGKKLLDKLPKERAKFIDGSIKNGHTKEKAEEVFNMIEKFGRYGFNLAHSAVYSALSYVTAYLKANYTVEYMTALLNANCDNNEKLSKYIDESYRLGIDIRTPDINKSNLLFEHDKENKAIIFGFNGIKGMGDSAINSLTAERKNGAFKSFIDIIERMPSINKKTLECLIKSGALNSIEQSPYKFLPLLDFFAKVKAKADYKKGNISLYKGAVQALAMTALNDNKNYQTLEKEYKGIKSTDKDARSVVKNKMQSMIDEECVKYENIEYMPDTITIKNDETELLGFPISVNPKKALIQFKDNIKYISIKDMKETKDYSDNFVIMATLKNISKTKNGSYFAIFSDESAEITTFISADNYEANQAKLITGSIFRIYCQLGKSYKPEKYDDNLKITHIRYFNIGLTGSLIKLKCNLDNQRLSEFLTKIRDRVILYEEDINYRLEIQNNDKIIKTNIDFWVPDLESISELMIEYNVMMGE